MKIINEFKPALFFIVKFIGLYFILNFLYGFYITAYYPLPDPITSMITKHVSVCLDIIGYNTNTLASNIKPIVALNNDNVLILSVYEGCNGINVVIIFISFIFVFSVQRDLFWFVPLGFLAIYISNLIRISMLFLLTIHMPDFSYFAHKYLFTASIFFVVFLLWYWWVKLSTAKSLKREA